VLLETWRLAAGGDGRVVEVEVSEEESAAPTAPVVGKAEDVEEDEGPGVGLAAAHGGSGIGLAAAHGGLGVGLAAAHGGLRVGLATAHGGWAWDIAPGRDAEASGCGVVLRLPWWGEGGCILLVG